MTLHDWEQYHLTDAEREQARERRAKHHDKLQRAAIENFWAEARMAQQATSVCPSWLRCGAIHEGKRCALRKLHRGAHVAIDKHAPGHVWLWAR